MSGFSAEWLTLREPFDLRARNAAVLDAVASSLKPLPSVRIVDLACGTGSTLRALSPRLPVPQRWKLVDNDFGLLERARRTPLSGTVNVETMPLDLNRDLEAALDGPIDLVTTSALLDLVSEPWLERLAVEIAARKIPFYAALSYDGRVALSPADALDQRIVDGMNAHQRTDKGFGPALGPDAASAAIARFTSLGFSVTQGQSDWTMNPGDQNMQSEVLSGWANAAREIGAVSSTDSTTWLTRRRKLIASGRASLRVGHVDFFAAPTGTR